MLVRNAGMVAMAALIIAGNSGCALVAQGVVGATQAAKNRDVPETTQYAVQVPVKTAYSSAVQAIGKTGKLVASDAASGFVQGLNGAYKMTITVKQGATANTSTLEVSAQSQALSAYDLRGRDEVVKTFVTEFQSAAHAPLSAL